MTNEKIINDLRRYRYAGTAATLLEGGDALAAGVSLERVATDLGCAKELQPYVDGTLASENGIKIATSGLAKQYASAYKNASVADLFEVYAPEAKLTTPEKAIFGYILNSVGGRKLEDIKKEISACEKKLKDKNASESEILSTHKKLREYRECLGLISTLEQYYNLGSAEKVQAEAIKRQKKMVRSTLDKIVDGSFSMPMAA